MSSGGRGFCAKEGMGEEKIREAAGQNGQEGEEETEGEKRSGRNEKPDGEKRGQGKRWGTAARDGPKRAGRRENGRRPRRTATEPPRLRIPQQRSPRHFCRGLLCWGKAGGWVCPGRRGSLYRGKSGGSGEERRKAVRGKPGAGTGEGRGRREGTGESAAGKGGRTDHRRSDHPKIFSHILTQCQKRGIVWILTVCQNMGFSGRDRTGRPRLCKNGCPGRGLSWHPGRGLGQRSGWRRSGSLSWRSGRRLSWCSGGCNARVGAVPAGTPGDGWSRAGQSLNRRSGW